MQEIYHFKDLNFDKDAVLSYMKTAEWKQTKKESVSIITNKDVGRNLFNECKELNVIKNFFTKREIQLFYIVLLTKIESKCLVHTPPTFHSEKSDALNSISRTFDIVIPIQVESPMIQIHASTNEKYELIPETMGYMIPTSYDWNYFIEHEGVKDRYEIRLRGAEPLKYDLMKEIYTNDLS